MRLDGFLQWYKPAVASRDLIGRARLTLTVLIAVYFAVGAVQTVAAEAETIYLDETYISGNQELPKVLYILPWKSQSSGAIKAVRPGSSLDRVMRLVYPHEYRLELAFRAKVEKAESVLSNARPGNTQEPANGTEDTNGQFQIILKEE